MFTQPEVAGWVRLWPLLESLVSLLLRWLQKASALMNPIIVCAERMERTLLRNRKKLSNTQIPTDSSSIILVVSESLLIFHFHPKFNESGLAFSCWPVINCWPLLQRDTLCVLQLRLPLEGRLVIKVTTIPDAPEWRCFVLERPLSLYSWSVSQYFNSENFMK